MQRRGIRCWETDLISEDMRGYKFLLDLGPKRKEEQDEESEEENVNGKGQGGIYFILKRLKTSVREGSYLRRFQLAKERQSNDNHTWP